MSSARKYKCIFCSKTFERDKLSTHIDKCHSEMLNDDKGYTANRIVFDICNKKEPIGAGKGSCRICKKDTEWNEDLVRYNAYCSETCKRKAREQYKQNMLKVYGKTTLLDDMEWQENKMLANRGISGKYKWSDGTYKTYVGSYEKKFLEFCDNVLHIDSSDLVTPGPTIYYEYEGQEHTWITDAIYLPYKLVFDIKDGGNNKNNRNMPEYRAKQVQKEKFITDQGEYNYIRLTNNEFVQLLTIFAELKMLYLEEDKPKTISRIQEHMGPALAGGMPVGMNSPQPHAFIVNYLNKETFDRDYAISNDISSDYVVVRDKKTRKLKKVKSEKLLDENTSCNIYKYTGDVSKLLREVYYVYKNGIEVSNDYIPCLFTEFDCILSDDQIEYSELLEEVDIAKINEQFKTNLATMNFQLESVLNKQCYIFPVLDPVKYEYKKIILKEYQDVSILQSIDGKYFAMNKINGKRTRGVESIYDINSNMLNSVSSTY